MPQCKHSQALALTTPVQRGKFPPTNPPTRAAYGSIQVPRTGAALSLPVWSHRIALPPQASPPPSPSVPPRNDATIPDLTGRHRHAHGRIPYEGGVVLPPLYPVITSGWVNLTVPAPNRLQRECRGPQPDTVYVGAITYLPTGEGWRYLAVGLDLCSRAVVGWAMANHMRAELVNQALAMATCQRQPAA